MAYGGGLGAEFDLGAVSGRWDGVLFAEAVGAFLLELPAGADPAELFPGLPWRTMGRVTADQHLSFRGSGRSITVPMADLLEAWERPFPEIVG